MGLSEDCRDHSRTILLITVEVHITQTSLDFHREAQGPNTIKMLKQHNYEPWTTCSQAETTNWRPSQEMSVEQDPNNDKVLYSVVTMLIMCGQSIVIDSCEWLTWGKITSFTNSSSSSVCKGWQQRGLQLWFRFVTKNVYIHLKKKGKQW